MAVGVLLIGCESIQTPSPDRHPSSPTSMIPLSDSAVPEPSADAAAGPPLNDLERTVLGALASLGIEGHRGEQSPEGASIYATLDDGHELYVTAIPPNADRSDSVVVGRRFVAGSQVERIETSSGDTFDRFDCTEARYILGGTPPAQFDSFDAFLGAFIVEVGC